MRRSEIAEKIEIEAWAITRVFYDLAREFNIKEMTPDAVGVVVWERGKTKDIAAAARACGALHTLEVLARALGVEVTPETKEHFKWQDVIE